MDGLSQVQGDAPPSTAFAGANDELYSTATPGQEAGPQGSAIAATESGDSFLFVPNYEGTDAAGYLHVQVVTTPATTTAANSFTIDVYERLAAYIPGAPTSGTSAPLGAEVPTEYFWQSTPGPGQKLRAVCAVHVPRNSGLPNEDRTLLFLGLNLDPVFPVPDAQLGFFQVMDKSPGWLGQGATVDDGKYDYIGIIDITEMAQVPRESTNQWAYDDQAEWAARMRFLRLPPDLPSNWSWPPDPSCFKYGWIEPPQSFGACFNPEGYDWGMVDVHIPEHMGTFGTFQLECYGEEPTVDTAVPVLVVGSGTIASITSHPDNTWVYVLSSDENADPFLTDPCSPPAADPDGGWHIPHLYSLDLSAGDFTSQGFLDSYTGSVVKYRFNKLVAGCLECTDFAPPVPVEIHIPSYQRVHDANFVLPGMPGTAGVIPSPGPWDVAADGVEYPGENFLEPTARTRLVAFRNVNMLQHPARLYVGNNGWVFKYVPFHSDWEIPLPDEEVGAFFSFALPASSPGSPSYRRTITIPQVDSNFPGITFPRYFRLGGVAALPSMTRLIGIPDPATGVLITNSLKRNILVAIANDTTKQFVQLEELEDRLVVIQDQQDL